MYLLIIFLPLLSFLNAILFGKYYTKKGVIILSLNCLFLALILTFFSFYEIALSGTICYFTLFTWISSDIFIISWGFFFDTLTVSILIIIILISTLVHYYSIFYMKNDPHFIRFFSFLSLFTFFMIILVTSHNLLQLFLGWEGVGLCSYLLINFWYTRLQANKSALKALIINRIGDFGLLIGILLIFSNFYSLDYNIIFNLFPFFINIFINVLNIKINLLNLISFFLFIGAIGKSAQIGLHSWLPDAMEGPTPVSALIHAATMVTAGIFLIIRFSSLFEYTPNILTLITFIGGITSFFAGTTGIFQNDIKKIIAYSTCSQLGFMFFICGLSNYFLGFFHLINHAFFKALLFLGAGSIIHSLSDEQDFKKMGGFLLILPLTYSSILIGSLSLIGFPFLTGFYSKDIILEIIYSSYTVSSIFIYWLSTFSTLCTSIYSFRLIYFIFLIKNNSYKNYIKNLHLSNKNISIVLIILSFFSIFFGYITHDMFIGLGTNFYENSLFILPKNYLIIDSEFIPYYIKLIPTLFSFFGIFLIYIIYNIYFIKKKILSLFFFNKNLSYFYTFFNKAWLFNKIYNNFIIKNLFKFSYNITFQLIDKGIIEHAGPLFIKIFFIKISNIFIKFNNGFIYYYLYFIFFFILFFYFIFFF